MLEYKFSWAPNFGYGNFDFITKKLEVTNVSALNVKFFLKCPSPTPQEFYPLPILSLPHHTNKIYISDENPPVRQFLKSVGSEGRGMGERRWGG